MRNYAVLFIIAATTFTGCLCNPSEFIAEKIAETATEKILEHGLSGDGQKVKLDLARGQARVITEEGESVINAGKSAAIPADFPKDVTVPAKSQITMGITTPDGHVVAYKVDRQATEVLAEISAAMTKAQWQQNNLVDTGQHKVLVYGKDNRTTAYTIEQTDDAKSCSGQISVTVTKP